MQLVSWLISKQELHYTHQQLTDISTQTLDSFVHIKYRQLAMHIWIWTEQTVNLSISINFANNVVIPAIQEYCKLSIKITKGKEILGLFWNLQCY